MLRRILFYNHAVLEWSIRVLISLNIYLPASNPPNDNGYPENCLMVTLVAFWLWIAGLRWLSCVLLLLTFWINWMHVGA